MEMIPSHDSGPASYHFSKNAAPPPAAAAVARGEGFCGLFLSDRCYSGDLLDLVWQEANGFWTEGGQPSCPPLSPPVAVVPERLAPEPPSEAEMSAWLLPIIIGGEEPGGEGDNNVASRSASMDDDDQKLPTAMDEKSSEGTESGSSVRRKTSTAAARRSRHAKAHSLTEKRRRSKINEKFRILKQLVPGCDKCNQASTLEQTIQYIKSQQQQIQAMSSGCGMKPAAAAVCPVVQPPSMPPPAAAGNAARPSCAVDVGTRTGTAWLFLGPSPAMMVQYGGMFPLVHQPVLRSDRSWRDESCRRRFNPCLHHRWSPSLPASSNLPEIEGSGNPSFNSF